MTSDAQKRASAKYRQTKVKQVNIKFFPSEQYLFDHMDKQGGRGSYIKRLIKEDYERENFKQTHD